MNWYLKVLQNYATFDGRARRSEYWYFVLFNIIIGVVLGFVDGAAGLMIEGTGQGILGTIYSLAVLIPGIAVAVRRLHDIGKSGWSLFIILIPCAGAIILLLWYIRDSEAGSNKYGPNPKLVPKSGTDRYDS